MRFVLDQHAELNLYSASSLRWPMTDWNGGPLLLPYIPTAYWAVSKLVKLAHSNNSPQIDMFPNPNTVAWFRVNQSLLFLLNAVMLAEKQQIPFFESLVWPNRDSNSRSPTLEASTLTITLLMRLLLIRTYYKLIYVKTKERDSKWNERGSLYSPVTHFHRVLSCVFNVSRTNSGRP